MTLAKRSERRYCLRPKRGPRRPTLRETQRYFDQHQRKPITLVKVRFLEVVNDR